LKKKFFWPCPRGTAVFWRPKKLFFRVDME
jgi:hypothetical protein